MINSTNDNLRKIMLQHLWNSGKGPSHNCEFCNNIFHEGYATLDFKHRICPKCYESLKDKFEWELQDWRLGRDQEKYLKGAKIKQVADFKKFSEAWDHEHCEFCWAKFAESEGALHEGYCTLDEKNWVCPICYEDFKEMFAWKLEQE